MVYSGIFPVESEDFEPLRVDLKHESLIIEGVVVGVVRQEAGRA